MNTRELQRTRGLPLFRGINFSTLEVDADLGGTVFAIGSVACLLIGLPLARALFGGGLAGGAILAVVIAWWHGRHPWPGAESARHGTFGDLRAKP